MAPTGTSTALTVGKLGVDGVRLPHFAPALHVTLDKVVQTVLPALQAIVDHLLMIALLILVKPHQPLLTMGLTVTSTASMGGTLAGLLAPAPALATLGLVGVAVKALYIIWLI